MRKAKITGCVAKMVGIEMTDAAIGVGFKVGRLQAGDTRPSKY